MNGRTGAGRPSNKIETNFNQPKISLNQIKVFCKNKIKVDQYYITKHFSYHHYLIYNF